MEGITGAIDSSLRKDLPSLFSESEFDIDCVHHTGWMQAQCSHGPM